MDNNFLEFAVNTAEKANPERDGDFIGEDGLLYCGSCCTPKQARLSEYSLWKDKEMIVPIMCRCAIDAKEARDEEIKANERELIRQRVFNGGTGFYNTFENDDNSNTELSRICRAYADKFSLKSDWLLLYGGCGVGKSFMACCVANRLIDKDYSVVFTSVSQIERNLWSAENKSTVYEKLERCDLLVIDDLFSQRESGYMNEITFNIIDGRIRCGKPAVITTNIGPKEFLKPSDLAAGRIMSRLYEKSIPFMCDGEDRRLKHMKETAEDKIKKLLE